MFKNYYEFETFARKVKLETGKLFGQFNVKTIDNDPDVSFWIAKDGYWESFVSYKIANYFDIIKPEICVDVGAHIGYYSLLFLWLGAKVVYAFEPNPLAFSVLSENIRMNNLHGELVVNNCAVLENNFEEVFLDDTFGTPNSFVSHSGKYKVFSVSLDNFFYNKDLPDFIKIDAEGSEERIIAGMEKILKSNKKLGLVIEIARGRGYDVIELFNHIGKYFDHWFELISQSDSETIFYEYDFYDVMFWR